MKSMNTLKQYKFNDSEKQNYLAIDNFFLKIMFN